MAVERILVLMMCSSDNSGSFDKGSNEYAALLIDLSVVPLLLGRRTRWLEYIVTTIIHLMNSVRDRHFSLADDGSDVDLLSARLAAQSLSTTRTL